MTAPRRYTEAEIAAIFEQAAADQQEAQPEGGLTLEELQQIGAASGLDPALVARAARRLDTQPLPAPPPPRAFGARTAVAHTAELPGPLSDAAWDRLVVDLRDTFHARGTLRTEGRTREWSNGNLHVMAEPVGEGHRVRFRSTNANVQARLGMSLVFPFLALFIGVALLAKGKDAALVMPLMMLLGAAGLYGWSRAEAARWAATREGQFEVLGRRAAALAEGPEARPEALAAPPQPAGGALASEPSAARLDAALLEADPSAAHPRSSEATRTRS